VVEKRTEFVLLASKEESNMSVLRQRFGISRKTGDKWLKRHAEGTPEALRDRSRLPVRSPRRMCGTLEEAVLSIRETHPAWGGHKIMHVPGRDRQQRIDPAASEAAIRSPIQLGTVQQ
jgi:hypothetical protein